MLTTDDLQFGFKPNLSCDSAIFTWRTTVDHYGRTLSDASMLYFADVFYIFLWPP